MIENLNHLEVETVEAMRYTRQLNAASKDGNIEVYFDNLQETLIRHLRKSVSVFGCVAWLTSEPILKALARCNNVSIVVQKEDFLRPDLSPRSGWSRRLRTLYSNLKIDIERWEMSGLLAKLNQNGDPSMFPVQCVGNFNQDKNPAFPRSHHKFIVMRGKDFSAVWTGSFNFTKNATHSFENALLIKDSQIIDAYMREFEYIYALSEPLDWESVWVAPEYRIGT